MARRPKIATQCAMPQSRIRPSLSADATPEEFAEAMVACQGYAPACSDANECSYDDMCFSSSGRGFRGARGAIKALVDSERDVSTRVWLKLALDAIDHHKFLARGAIDALKVVAINKAVREEYGAPKMKGDD